VLDRLAGGPAPELEVAPSSLLAHAVARLRRRGLVRVATFTPTDAAHLLGHLADGDTEAARLGAELLARHQDVKGRPVAGSGLELASLVELRLITRSVECVLEAALTSDGLGSPGVVSSAVVQAALAGHRGLAVLSLGLSGPITAVGASAATYYGRVAAALGTEVILPPHAEVANAVGAVVGRIRIRRQATVTQPRSAQYRVHAGDQSQFGSIERARRYGQEILGAEVARLADAAGAANAEISYDWSARTAMVNGKEVLVEGIVSATATGRPRIG
jgi:N-methylhydantoinase A/oxoprolinase/acetone carboxylase beta subunit